MRNRGTAVNTIQRRIAARQPLFFSAGTSIGANIHEAQYAHGKADFVSKLQIALKESNETSYWLLLLNKTNIIPNAEYERLENLCKEIRITLIASVNTAKQNIK